MSDGEIVGGVVNGEVVHMDCATPEEREGEARQWAAFYQRRQAVCWDLKCERCGARLITEPISAA